MIKKFARDLKTEFKGYGIKTLSQDAMAGLTVAAVALPLALAFGVSSGADAASGLITAIFAGLIIEKVLGLKCYSIEEVPSQKVKTAFFKIGQTKLELLEPTSEDSAIAKFIEKRGEGVHHVAFATEDLPQALADAEAAGVQLIDKAPRAGAEGLEIAFLHPKSTKGVLTELCFNPNK